MHPGQLQIAGASTKCRACPRQCHSLCKLKFETAYAPKHRQQCNTSACPMCFLISCLPRPWFEANLSKNNVVHACLRWQALHLLVPGQQSCSALLCRYTTAIVSPSRAPQYLLNSGPRRADEQKADAEQKLVRLFTLASIPHGTILTEQQNQG